ncbi:MAG TPA: response regulator transcription factor, partial [Patescibacteria group bacterium]|nr:response regulator transcription factor [Patescibacteria group bacterium]
IRDSAPDVVLCDILLQGETGGFEILRHLHPGDAAAVLFLSSFDYPAFQQHALELGARGYLLKTSSVREIVDAIRRVVAGGTAFTVAAIRDAHALSLPSNRELELIRLIRAGLSNDEAAIRLGIGTRGVESSLRRLFLRYGIMDRTGLVTFVEEQGWLKLPNR